MSVCPVPPEQRPINEYQELKESWFFSWVLLEWPRYLGKLLWIWGGSWLIVGPIAAASFPPLKYPGKFILSGGAGACFLLGLVLLRLFLGWYYVRSRLLNTTIVYEESGWYDGQTWTKTPEFIAQDQLILNYQVKPLLGRVQKTIYGLILVSIIGGLIWILL